MLIANGMLAWVFVGAVIQKVTFLNSVLLLYNCVREAGVS